MLAAICMAVQADPLTYMGPFGEPDGEEGEETEGIGEGQQQQRLLNV